MNAQHEPKVRVRAHSTPDQLRQRETAAHAPHPPRSTLKLNPEAAAHYSARSEALRARK